jgi:hypothetical protein
MRKEWLEVVKPVYTGTGSNYINYSWIGQISLSFKLIDKGLVV